MFTYHVFQHALRIRFEGSTTDVLGKNEANIGALLQDENVSSTQGTASDSVDTDDIMAGTMVNDDISAGVIDPVSPVESRAKERSGHLTGKINNLLTGDLHTISNSFDIVAIRKSIVSVQVYCR